MAKVFSFGDFTLDTGALELRCGPVVVPVEPLVFDLITLLLEQPGVVVSRDQLVEIRLERANRVRKHHFHRRQIGAKGVGRHRQGSEVHPDDPGARHSIRGAG